MKTTAERLLKAVGRAERMARGRLCVLSRTRGGGAFYHLQYRKDTKLHQRHVDADWLLAAGWKRRF